MSCGITFSYLDGPKTIEEFVRRRTPPGQPPRPYSYLLYARLGDLYIHKERYTDAAYVTGLSCHRTATMRRHHLLEMQAIEAYQKGRIPAARVAGQEGVETCAGRSCWLSRPKAERRLVSRVIVVSKQ